jgi:hypothetical protein
MNIGMERGSMILEGNEMSDRRMSGIMLDDLRRALTWIILNIIPLKIAAGYKEWISVRRGRSLVVSFQNSLYKYAKYGSSLAWRETFVYPDRFKI